MKTMNAQDAIKKIEQDAKARAKPDPVVYGTMSVGDCHWQGDVGIVRLKKLPKGCNKMWPYSGQLAKGTTRGARHLVKSEHMSHCRILTNPNATELDGPIIEADAPVEIEHPDHGHVTVPAGSYRIRYQRAYAEELRRVRD